VGSEIFSFMDGFFWIQSDSDLALRINIRQCLYVLGGLSHIKKMPFGLKNVGATFQWAMSFTFHDLKHIVEAYLDDLVASLARG
jgi:hypothetical protein